MNTHTLYFIGIGLFDEKDMTLKAKEIISQCTKVYAEFYTSVMMGTSLSTLEQIIGKNIQVLNRDQTEQGDQIFSALKNGDIAFITGGDAMAATTHVDLRIRAIKQGYQTKLIHGTSILTAVPGLLGLQHYKFGRTTTLVAPEKNFFPTSPYDVIKQNKTQGLHTLILLDIKQEKNYFMTASEAIELLLKMENIRKENVIHPNDMIGVVAQAGSEKPLIKSGTITSLQSMNFGPPLHTLVYPAELHFMEKEAFTLLSQ